MLLKLASATFDLRTKKTLNIVKPSTQFLILPTCLLVIALTTLSCKRSSRADTSIQKCQITPEVWLHKTSENTLSLTDKSGKALVAGNVLRTLRVGTDSQSLLIEYMPSPPDASDTSGGLKYAQVDLSSASVTPAPKPDSGTLNKMVSADLLFPLP